MLAYLLKFQSIVLRFCIDIIFLILYVFSVLYTYHKRTQANYYTDLSTCNETLYNITVIDVYIKYNTMEH